METADLQLFIPYKSLQQAAEEIASRINRDMQGKHIMLLCVLSGAYQFATDVSRHITLPCQMAFIKYTSYAGRSSTGMPTQMFTPTLPVTGKDVVVVEDIIETGQTMQHLVEYLRHEGVSSYKIATLLFKPHRLKCPVQPDYVGFEIQDQFIVGYGLDRDDYDRNLKDIYELKE